MGLKIATQKNLPIGVDLGSASLKMAQLRTDGSRVELFAAAAAEVPLSCRDDLVRRMEFQSGKIRSLVRSGGFKGRQAVLSLPAAATFVQPVKVPMLRPKEMDQAVKSELRGKLPYPVEDAVIRHMLAATVYSDGEDVQERIVVAVSRDDLERYLNVARHASLDVVGVNIESCAVVECFARLFRRATDESRVTLFIDMGSASTQVVLAHGPRMVFARNLAAGGRSLDQAIAETLGVSLDKAHCIRTKVLDEAKDPAAEDDLYRLLDSTIAGITEQIMQCLRYYESVFRNHSIERVIFLGGQAHNRRLCQSIAERLNLPAQVGDPMVGLKRTGDAGLAGGLDPRQPQPSWAVAIGLSLGAGEAA